MIGIYFSGTGNTKHCVEKLVKLLDASAQSFSLEHTQMIQILEEHDIIVLGYPTQFSNAPIIVRDFIKNHSSLWNGKKVFCVNTMGLFSGDGTGCTARILRKRGATILGGLQIKMPDSVCDSKLLKKTPEENREIVRQADQKIEAAARQIKQGNYPPGRAVLLFPPEGTFWTAAVVLRQDGGIHRQAENQRKMRGLRAVRLFMPHEKSLPARRESHRGRPVYHVLPLYQPLSPKGHHAARGRGNRAVPV